MSSAYIKLGIAALLPVLAAVIVYELDKKTKFGSLNRMKKQLLIGVVFGGLAIVGTEWGIPFHGAQANCRDAAVLIAGLLFGGPAGILAGLIGGAERWIAVVWGVGTFTRVACTVSTIVAGIYAALLRRFMFEERKPGWMIAFAIGVVMEVFHLTMVFLTNMATAEKALQSVSDCGVPMIIANGLSVMLAAMLVSLAAGERITIHTSEIRISQTVQRWLLLVVALAFVATSGFVASLQSRIAEVQAEKQMELVVAEVKQDIIDASNQSLVSMAHMVVEELPDDDLNAIANRHHIREISVADGNGIIIDSTEPSNIGFDMGSRAQSAEFLCLLGDTAEYAQEYGPVPGNERARIKYAGVKTPDGFVQVGYGAPEIRNAIRKEIEGLTRNRHVGGERCNPHPQREGRCAQRSAGCYRL